MNDLTYFLEEGDKSAQKALFLHGIMGRGQNLYTMVKEYTRLCGNTAVVFDLPNHGKSLGNYGTNIQEIAQLIDEKLKEDNIDISHFIGHSYGSKVAALVAHKRKKQAKTLWMLDASPKKYSLKPFSSKENLTVFEIMDIIRDAPWPFADKKSFFTYLQNNKVSKQVANWLLTMQIQKDNNFYFLLDIKKVKFMLQSFLDFDTWPILRDLSHFASVHLVKAENSDRLSTEDENNLKSLQPGKGFFHIVNDTSHFLHAEKPQEIARLIAASS